MRRGAWVVSAALVWWGCSGEQARVPADEQPVVEVLLDREVSAAAPFVVMRALGASIRTDPDGSARLLVDLAIENDQAPRFDGATSYPSAFGLRRDNVKLVIDGVELPPNPTDEPGFLPDHIAASEKDDRRVRGLLAYDLPQAWSPDRIELVIDTARGKLRLPIAGELRLSDGTPAQVFEVVGPDLRPLPGASLTLLVDGSSRQLVRPEGFDTWLIPLVGANESVTARVEAPGHRAVELSLTGAELAALPPVQLVRLSTLWDADAGLSALLPARRVDRAQVDVAGVADALSGRTAAEIGQWVRERIAVLPTHGVQQSASAVVRRGAGGPMERAMLGAELLRANGMEVHLVCGDLSPTQAEAIFAMPPASPPLSPRLTELSSQVAALADRLAPELERTLLARPSSGPLGRERVALVPEWCWLQAKSGGVWQEVDLRPAPFDQDPLPMTWRVVDDLRRETWRMRFTLTAYYGREDEDGSGDVLSYLVMAPELSEIGLAVDLWSDDPSSDPPGSLRTMLSVVRGALVDVQQGKPVLTGGLERLVLRTSWIDPLEITTRSYEVPLWEARAWREGEQARPLQQLRAVLSSDSGAANEAAFTYRAGLAFGGRHATPAVHAMLLRHELYAFLRRQASAGVVPAEPSLFVSVFDAVGAALHQQSFDDLYVAAPARAGGAGDVAARARLAAAGSAAFSVLSSLVAGSDAEAEALPTAWVVDPSALDPLQGFVRTRVRRAVHGEGVWVATTPDGGAWTYDLLVGGFGHMPRPSHDVVTVRPAPLGADLRAPELALAHVRWDRPLRCADAPLWRDVLYGDRVKASGCSDVPGSGPP